MNPNDYKKAITAEDLIRRYNLDGLKTDRKIITQFGNSLVKQHNIIKNYITNITPYKGQADRLTAWFFNGVPSLENNPFITFTEEEKEIRLNDLYYDKDTGYAYQFQKDETYFWKNIDDINLIKSLALANGEYDTFDNKRNTFFFQPFTPYEIGDVWIDGNVIMRCRSSRSEGLYNSVDWVTQDDYSNDLVMKDTRAVLDEFKETVTTDYVTKVLLETSVDSITAEVQATTTKITENMNGRFEETDEKISKLNVTVGEISASVSDEIKDIKGNVEKVEGNLSLYIKKNDKDEVVSAFNLNSNEVEINSDNFTLTKDGSLTCSNALIKDGKLIVNDKNAGAYNNPYDVIQVINTRAEEVFGETWRTTVNSSNIKLQSGSALPIRNETMIGFDCDWTPYGSSGDAYPENIRYGIYQMNQTYDGKGEQTTIINGFGIEADGNITIRSVPTSSSHAVRLQDLDSKGIYESGNNSYGNYVKFGNGIMICWNYKTFGSQNLNNQSWGNMYLTSSSLDLGSFPQNFTSNPAVFIMPMQPFFIRKQYNANPRTSWGMFYPCAPAVATGFDVTVSCFAIGNWK